MCGCELIQAEDCCFYAFKQHYFRIAYAGPSSNICPSAKVLWSFSHKQKFIPKLSQLHPAGQQLESEDYYGRLDLYRAHITVHFQLLLPCIYSPHKQIHHLSAS